MPLGRFQIRNEYSFADPDLYKAADKDDPEALLEGVAMAGFVGVLRQLGDLAQFAAEIFHDLHEEVMATAARGHGLIVRVQQLEAEFPLVERTLLSKTCHTAFLYNSGIDCHPNARMDENVIAQGDLPRFIMDSYEECRGPPRLFLLDKFDVAGAGACLKRFSDPSFFRMEATSSSSKKSDGQREKKTRRVKKRGTCWRNGDTPETFPSTHAKLHQLFLEELIETGGNDPDRSVKLKKRQFTGSLFDQDKRRSYMDKFLDSCSPEQKIVHEVCIDALPLTWISDNACESGLEIVAIGSDSPVKQSFSASPDTREVVLEPAFEGISEGKLNDMIYGRAAQDSRLNHDSDDGKVSSTISKVKSEEACAVAESKSELSDGDGNYSDNFASDIDDYMDALATMESDVETDSECKKHPRYSNLKPIVVDSDASEGPRDPHGLFLDSQSLGNSTASEDGNNFFRERQCSSRSISVNSTAETSTYLDAAVVAVPSVSVSTSDADNVYLAQHSVSEDMPKSKTEESSIVAVEADDTSNTVAVEADDDDMSHTVPEFGDASDTSYFTNSNTILNSADMEAILRESSLTSPGVDEVGSNSAEPDILSGMSDLQHTNQTISSGHMSSAQQPLHDDGIVFDAPERTDSGHWSRAKQPMHDDTIVFYVPETMESGHWSSAQKPMRDVESHSSSVYSESFPDPENTHDGVLQIEPKKSDLVSSLVQKHSDDFGVANVSSTCDPIVPVMVNPVNDAPDLDSCISSTEENSYDQYSASNSMQKVINQEESEMTNHSLTYPPDNEAACLSCSSQSDSSVKEVFNNVESEEKASSALIVAQTEDLPLLISRGLETCDSEPIFSGTTDAADENGSFEAAVAGAVSSGDEPDSGLPSGSAGGHSSVIDPLETTDHPHKLPSEISDAALFKRGRAQNDEHYPGNETAEQQNSVSSGWDEYEGAPNVNMFDGDAVCSSVTSVYLNQPDLVETIENLEKDEPIAVQFDATSALDCNDATSALDCNSKNNDENESFSHENLPFEESSMVVTGSSSILAAQSDSDQCHTMGRLEHEETGTNGSKQVDIEGYPNENTLLATPVSVSGEEQEQPVSVTKNYHDNEEELVVCPSAKLVAEEHVDLVENASEDIQSSENFDAVEAPLTSEDGNEHLDSSSNQGHLLERTEENVGSLTDDNSKTTIPLEKELDLRDDESKLKTLLTNRQMQTPDSLSKEEILDSLYDDGQPLMPGLPAQPAVNLLGSFSQPMVELSSFLHDNSMLNDSNQATQMVESLGQPIQTSGFPVHGMLPPEPQINLDSPPLPPLPPMQWRLSRLQNPSAPTERQMFHHTQGSVQPMTLPTNGGETNTSTYTVNSAEQPVSSNVLAQEVLAQPLAAPASEVYVENNRIEIQREDLSLTTQTSINSQNEIQREDLSLTTQTSVSSQNGTSVSEECNQPIPNHAEPQSLAEGRVSPTDSPVEATVHADNSAQSDRLKHIPLVTDQAAVNSHVHFLSSAPMHYDWQLHPGLIAPEARIAWPTAFDGMLTDTGVYANGALQKKAPRPRNPLIDEVVAIDKSKLRKVERVKPSVEQKPDEGESFLEQLQLRKVERVKPPAESKAQEGESLLENLQLRKVKERIKPSVDSKNEEREFSLQQLQLRKVGESTKPQAELKTEERESPLAHIQLRKVRERVKSEAEQKAEEKESLQVPLRKVSDRVKPEVEQKPEETESPRVQLRKVDERVKPEIQHKPEDPESPRVQLRKVSDKAKLVVQQQPEETESPRVQLRKVGQATLTPAAPKIERRDSILEQIRNKSFSLRPAIAARPNIQGPRTNLKVAAILEKASNIRQAMAGSDEEDDGDTWSEC